MSTVTFYDNPSANAPIRVRIVLLLKQVAFEPVLVDVYSPDGEAVASDSALNPQRMVPALRDGEFVLSQSMAIIEYLEERFPEPPILPGDARGRARVRSLAQLIACDAQPLVNFRVREALRHEFGLPEGEVRRWVVEWLARSLRDLEASLARHSSTGRYCHGDTPTLADVCLFPHVLIAQRFGVPLDDYPTVMRVFEACRDVPAFRDAQVASQASSATTRMHRHY